MSKLNVGVGADFPVDAAEPSPSDDERDEGCRDRHFRHRYRHRFGRRHGWRGTRFFYFGPLTLIVFIALISLAISYPLVVLGLIVVAAISFAARRHQHHWDDGDDDRYDRGDRYEQRRDRGFDPRDRDVGPQPDAPDGAAPGRS